MSPVSTCFNLFQPLLVTAMVDTASLTQDYYDAVKGVYHRHCLKHHPDKPGGSKDDFVKVTAVRDVIFRKLGKRSSVEHDSDVQLDLHILKRRVSKLEDSRDRAKKRAKTLEEEVERLNACIKTMQAVAEDPDDSSCEEDEEAAAVDVPAEVAEEDTVIARVKQFFLNNRGPRRMVEIMSYDAAVRFVL